MCCGVGVNDERLHVCHVSQQREDLQGVDELPSVLLCAINLEGEDAAATIGEVLLVELVDRM